MNATKKALITIISLILISLTLPIKLHANEIGVTIDAQQVIFVDQPPIIANGRTLVPLRDVFEALGFYVEWNPDTQQVSLTSDIVIIITIGSNEFSANGITHTLDVPAQIIGGTTMLPIRHVLESVGYYVDWDAAANMVIITSASGIVTGERTTISTRFGAKFVICADGYLWAWGCNAYGRLGDGERSFWGGKDDDGIDNDRLVPVRIMSNVAYVSAGVVHTMAITVDGSLWGWGSNESGQLGDGTGGEWGEYSPLPVKIMDDVVTVSAGGHHTMAIRADGSLWAWGSNRFGQLGDLTSEMRTAPVKVMDNVAAVSAGQEHTMAIKSDGTLWAWGSNRFGNLGIGISPTPSTQIAHEANIHPNPVQVLENVAAVSVGNSHTMAIRADGSLLGWGINWSGELGLGFYDSSGMAGRPMNPASYRAIPVRIFLHDDAVAVSAGGRHTLVLMADSSLWGWGGSGRDFGVNTEHRGNISRPMRLMDNVAMISAGSWGSLIVKHDGSVYHSTGRGAVGDGSVGSTEFVRVMERALLTN